MTGTGTASDPYIISSWADMESVTTATAYYKLDCDLDANDRNGGVWTTLTMNCAELDGAGHTIRNIDHTSSGYALNTNRGNPTEFMAVKSLKFVNCRSRSGFWHVQFGGTTIYRRVDFQSCEFIVTTSDRIFNIYNNAGIRISDSVLSLKISNANTSPLMGNYTLFQRCHIALDITAATSGNIELTSAGNYYMDTCRVTGTLNLPNNNDTYIYAKNSVIAIATTATGTLYVNSGAAAAVDVSVVDTSITAQTPNLTYAAGGTTAQLGSVEWLTAQGFGVV